MKIQELLRESGAVESLNDFKAKLHGKKYAKEQPDESTGDEEWVSTDDVGLHIRAEFKEEEQELEGEIVAVDMSTEPPGLLVLVDKKFRTEEWPHKYFLMDPSFWTWNTK